MAKKLFSKENQPQNKRGKDKRKLLVEALERKGFSEEKLYDTIVEMAMIERDTAMMKELIVRFSPLPKPVAPVFEVDFPDDGTPVEKIDAVIRGIASGVIPVDIGKTFAEVIRTGLDIAEVTELAARLERLEKLLEQQNA